MGAVVHYSSSQKFSASRLYMITCRFRFLLLTAGSLFHISIFVTLQSRCPLFLASYSFVWDDRISVKSVRWAAPGILQILLILEECSFALHNVLKYLYYRRSFTTSHGIKHLKRMLEMQCM